MAGRSLAGASGAGEAANKADGAATSGAAASDWTSWRRLRRMDNSPDDKESVAAVSCQSRPKQKGPATMAADPLWPFRSVAVYLSHFCEPLPGKATVTELPVALPVSEAPSAVIGLPASAAFTCVGMPVFDARTLAVILSCSQST